MEQALYQKQKLQLVITNKMEQQLSLLHMPIIDLGGYLMNQALENPFIDIDSFNTSQSVSKKHKLTNKNQDWLNYIEQPKSLYDFLLEQLSYLKLEPMEHAIIEYFIFLIDENGYFRGDLQEVSEHFIVPVELLEKSLYLLQTFEPVGIGARNLQECLLIQLKVMDVRNELAELVVSNYFELLVERKWKEISQKVGVDVVEIQFVFDVIKTLNPKPGSSFQNGYSQQIKPELLIHENSTGFKVMINDALYPKLLFDSSYHEQIDSFTGDVESNYLQEKFQHFHWLQQSLAKRKKTLVNVMEAIVDRQLEFFEKGIVHLKPLTIKEIADAVELHESTVSRAVNRKYVQTPHGLFEMKYFFTSSIAVNGKEETSSKVVKQAISNIVETENKLKPYSDQKIVELLERDEGFNLSRRTVTKYREQLGIPSSSKRKRY